MLNKISTKLAEELLFKGAEWITYGKEVYIYGIEIILSTLIEMVTILLLAALFSEITEGLIFIGGFFFLRIFSGGYHADTYRKCFLVTIGAFLSILILTEILNNLHLT